MIFLQAIPCIQLHFDLGSLNIDSGGLENGCEFYKGVELARSMGRVCYQRGYPVQVIHIVHCAVYSVLFNGEQFQNKVVTSCSISNDTVQCIYSVLCSVQQQIYLCEDFCQHLMLASLATHLIQEEAKTGYLVEHEWEWWCGSCEFSTVRIEQLAVRQDGDLFWQKTVYIFKNSGLQINMSLQALKVITQLNVFFFSLLNMSRINLQTLQFFIQTLVIP